MRKIHKKHILMMALAGAAILVLGGGYFLYFQNHLSREARMYGEEMKLLKNHLIIAPDRPEPEAVKVPILVYHHIGPLHAAATKNLKAFSVDAEMFEKHLAYLQSKAYTTISYEQLDNYLLYGAKLPEKPVIISFDDGWENQYTYALPLLLKYGFTATFFIPTGIIGHRHLLSWAEIKKLDRAGMVIGSHSETHPFLDKIPDEQLKKETMESKKILESGLGKPVNDFAYPYGEYNDRVIRIAKAAGYRTARTTDLGIYQKRDIIFRLKGMLTFNNFDGFLKNLGEL